MPNNARKLLSASLWYAWCAALFAALLWARARQPNLPPPTREAFEERHRVSYDIYAASSLGQAYDLLAATFDGAELDRQYCLYAKAAKQLSSAGASVTVWDMLYQDFKVLELHGDHCRVRSKWTVFYVLGHSRHSHIRSNAYEADFELRKDAGGWKIVSSRILSENNLA